MHLQCMPDVILAVIYIDGVYQSFTIDITAGVRDDDGSISDIL